MRPPAVLGPARAQALVDALQALDVGPVRGAALEVLQEGLAQEDHRVVAGGFPGGGRELLEQARGLRIPAPAVALRDAPERRQGLRQRRGHVEARQARRVALAVDRQHALGPAAQREALLEPLLHRLERGAEGRVVVRDQVRPRGAPRRRAADLGHVGGRAELAQEALEGARQARAHFAVVDALAVQHLDPVLRAEALARGPAAEAGVVGGDRRHAERQALLRRVAPGLVVGGEAGQVERAQHGLVGQISGSRRAPRDRSGPG